MDKVVKTDRLDPLKLTEVANSTIAPVRKVRDQTRSLTRDIAFPCGKPTARAPSHAQVAVKAETPNVTQGDAQVGDNDDTMGAHYEVEPEVDDTQASTQMVIEDDDPVGDSLIYLYDTAFKLPLAKPVCTTALSAVQRSANLLCAEGKESLKREVKQVAKSVLSSTDPYIGLDTEEARV